MLRECEAYVAVSGYNNELYNELYDGWFRFDKSTFASSSNVNTGTKRVESLWINQRQDTMLPGF